MKFIIYWVTYLSSLSADTVNVSGTVFLDVDNKRVTTYVHDAGYVVWEIDHIKYSVLQDTPSRRKNQIDRCRIIAHKGDIRIVLVINHKTIKMDVDCLELGFHEHIECKRKL